MKCWMCHEDVIESEIYSDCYYCIHCSVTHNTDPPYPIEWNDVELEEAPIGEDLLVVKHYITHEHDPETGGYDDSKPVRLDDFITVDISFREDTWENGGIVTHWMPLPRLPKSKK